MWRANRSSPKNTIGVFSSKFTSNLAVFFLLALETYAINSALPKLPHTASTWRQTSSVTPPLIYRYVMLLQQNEWVGLGHVPKRVKGGLGLKIGLAWRRREASSDLG